jgi:hypothetical protein
MQVVRYTTKDGFAGVAWDQEVAAGTAYAHTRELQWKLAVLVGLVAFGIALGAGADFGTAVVGGLVVAALAGVPEAFRAMRLHVEGAQVGGLQRTDSEIEAERRAKVTRVYARERRLAEVRFEPVTKTLLFVLLEGGPDAAYLLAEIPLLSFQGLSLGTDQEWFGDIGSRELAQHQQIGSAWVIVAVAEGHGVVQIARSSRDQASIAHLHQTLRMEFIDRRREWVARAEELASRRRGPEGGSGATGTPR